MRTSQFTCPNCSPKTRASARGASAKRTKPSSASRAVFPIRFNRCGSGEKPNDELISSFDDSLINSVPNLYTTIAVTLKANIDAINPTEIYPVKYTEKNIMMTEKRKR